MSVVAGGQGQDQGGDDEIDRGRGHVGAPRGERHEQAAISQGCEGASE